MLSILLVSVMAQNVRSGDKMYLGYLMVQTQNFKKIVWEHHLDMPELIPHPYTRTRFVPSPTAKPRYGSSLVFEATPPFVYSAVSALVGGIPRAP